MKFLITCLMASLGIALTACNTTDYVVEDGKTYGYPSGQPVSASTLEFLNRESTAKDEDEKFHQRHRLETLNSTDNQP